MEQELRKPDVQWFKDILDSINVAIFVHNIETGAILEVNRAATELYGYTTEEMLQLTVADLSSNQPPYTQEKAVALVRDAARGGIPGTEWMARDKKGNLFWVEVNLRRATIQGSDYIIVTVINIEQRKKAEDRLKDSNRELEQFAYIASHDLQEPLRMVASFTGLLERRYKDRLDDAGREYMKFIVDGANRMQQLIIDLLAFSRAGRTDTERSPVDCNRIVKQVLADFTPVVRETGAQVTYDDLPIIIANPTSISRVFQNLIGNAIKFRRKDVPPEIHIGVQRKGQDWLFSVSDNGIGIEPKYFDRLFVIFQRLHPRTEYPGSGIGLAITRKIVESYGGKIWLESTPGQGTTFYFTLPIQ